MSLISEHLLQSLQPWQDAPCCWVGLSGGLDSTVLIHLLASCRDAGACPPLKAIHVNHGLSVDAGAWAEHCQSLCDSLGIELQVRSVQVQRSGSGLEAAAREARYAVFEELVGPGELLCLAHHADDQVETFFLRLLRGAGTHGLSAMPRQRSLGAGELLRPLLDYPRETLENYAFEQRLAWVDDDSNRDESLDRNYLRRRVLPALEERWPGYRSGVINSVAAVTEAEQTLSAQESVLLDAGQRSAFGEPILNLSPLEHCTAQQTCRLLRRWLLDEGVQPPGRNQLEEFVRQLQGSDPASGPSLLQPTYQLHRYRDELHLLPVLSALPSAGWSDIEPGGRNSWPGVGQLQMVISGSGLLRLPADGRWRVGFRQGGERCRPLGRRHSQSLKKLLQESAVPPWWRDRIPLLWEGDELAAVANLWVCEGFQAGDGEQGCDIRWNANLAAAVD